MLKTIDDLKIGSVIRFGSYSADKNDQSPPPIEWYKADQDNRLLSRYCIDYLVFDTIEHHTELYWLTPNADYALSNIHQFLNSEETEWWASTHPSDACPNRGAQWMSWASYAGHAGFLSLFESAELNSIEEVVLQNNIDDSDVLARVWLPSAADISSLPLFKTVGVRARMTNETYKKAQYNLSNLYADSFCPFWLRDSRTEFLSDRVLVLGRNAHITHESPLNSCGVRPLIKLAADTKVVPDGSGYTVVGRGENVPAIPTDESLFSFLGLV